MAQIDKIIDVAKGFVVVDPNTFAKNLSYTVQEDSPEKGAPILAYEGINFLPTAYGYRSYFGANSVLDITALTGRCDKVLLYQFATYQNILVALTEYGIKVSRAGVSGAEWVGGLGSWNFHDWLGGKGMIQASEDLALDPNSYYQWTYAVIENVLYTYRQGDAFISRIRPTDIDLSGNITITQLFPNFLNMEGQMGIFRANGRLGFWDSANSISWSSLFDVTDITPSLETLAGNAIFNGVLGRITTILPQGDGFVIYSTKNIVGVRYSNNAASIWEASTITDSAGVAYPHEVTLGLTDLQHYAYTNTGIKAIGAYNALNKSHKIDEIITDVYDLLKQKREPVYLNMINGRFLCFSLLSSDYIDGRVSFTFNDIGDLEARILFDGAEWDGLEVLPTTIEGISIELDIAGRIAAGARYGIYLWWTGTGRAMYPSIVTPTSNPFNRETAITPYEIDAYSIHVPNLDLDISSTFANNTNYADASEITILTDCEPENAVEYMEGGVVFPGLNQVGTEVMGLADDFLVEMIATQLQEWENFTDTQALNKTAIEAIPPAVSSIAGTTIYPTSGSAQTEITAQLAALLIANPGGTINGNTFTYPESSSLGSFLSGEGAITRNEFTGVGTYNGQYFLDKTFVGGWDVQKVITREYSIRQGTTSGWLATGIMSLTVMAYPTYIGTYPYVFADAGIPGNVYTFSTISSYDAMELQVPLVYAASPPLLECLAGSHPAYTGLWDKNPDYQYGTYSARYVTYKQQSEPTDIRSWILWEITWQGGVYPYYIDYADITTITTTANPALSLVSSMTAQQSELEWGIIPLGIPAGRFTSTFGAFTIAGADIRTAFATVPPLDVTYPGATFLINDGAPAPLYPTFVGALVLDTALQKWGKLKANHKALLDIAPINSVNAPLSFTNFGMEMGMLAVDGTFNIFDALPAESWMRYGKIGYYRLGVTQIQEVHAHFGMPSSGIISVDTSLDGRVIDGYYSVNTSYNSAVKATAYGGNVGSWHTITISGIYDLTYMEFRGNIAGRR